MWASSGGGRPAYKARSARTERSGASERAHLARPAGAGRRAAARRRGGALSSHRPSVQLVRQTEAVQLFEVAHRVSERTRFQSERVVCDCDRTG